MAVMPTVDRPASARAKRFRSVIDYGTEASLRAALAEPRGFLPPRGGPRRAARERGSHSSLPPLSSSFQGIHMRPCVIDEVQCGRDWNANALDPATSHPLRLEEEVQRLLELKEYSLLDTEPEAKIERFTALASRIFDVPICLVSLVDIGRQWFKSNRGLGEVHETSREVSFCAHAILSTHDVFIVPDALQDSRFANNSLVTGPPHIRFYASVPLVTPKKHKLGTFCIIDNKPRPEGLTLAEKQNLRELTDMVMDTLIHRKSEMERLMDEKARMIACAAHDLLSPLTGIKLSLGLLTEDEALRNRMDSNQRELMQASVECLNVMERICTKSIKSFRDDLTRARGAALLSSTSAAHHAWHANQSSGSMDMDQFTSSIERVIGTYPKKVPFFVEKSENVPPAILCDDLKLFRSVLNYLTNACKHTRVGMIRMRIYVRKSTARATPEHGGAPAPKTAQIAPERDVLIVEVHDTGPGIDAKKRATLFTPLPAAASSENRRGPPGGGPRQNGLGLFSVAEEIGSLGGEYGVFPREDLVASHASDDSDRKPISLSGCVFWLSVPLVLPRIRTATARGITQKASSTGALNCRRRLNENRRVRRLEMNKDKKNEVFEEVFDAAKPLETVTQYPKLDSAKDAMKRSFNTAIAPPVAVRAFKPGKSTDSNDRSSSAQQQLPVKRKRRILVVDDSTTIRKCLVKGFLRLGFEVNEAENGMLGLQQLKANCFDLVLLDFLMPVMDGLDVARKFREWEREHRSDFRQHIIGISAHASATDAETGIKAGMDEFMGKPISLKSLKELVAQDRTIQYGSILS